MTSRAVVLIVCAVCSIALAAKKKPAPAPSASATTEAAIKKALDGAQEQVASCVVSGAPAGKWSLTAQIKLSITGAGQIMSLKIGLTPEPAGADKTRDCVEKVLRAVAFPKSNAPLINVDREWSFSMG